MRFSSLFVACLVAFVAACTTRASPDILACRLQPYTSEDLEACACTAAIEADGLATILVAVAGTYPARRSVIVTMDGAEVERGTTGDDGSLALLVTIPGRDRDRFARGVDLVVHVDRGETLVHVDGRREAFVESAEPPFQEADGEGLLEGTFRVRGIRYDGVERRRDLTPISRVLVANLDAPTAREIRPVPTLDADFAASVAGYEGDIAILALRHESGHTSGCWWPELDVESCPEGEECPGLWGGLGLRRAACSRRRAIRGECRADAHEAPDAGPDAGPVDASFDPDARPF